MTVIEELLIMLVRANMSDMFFEVAGKIQEKGLTLVPTKVFFNDKGRVKVDVSLAKGKKAYEKREAIRERDQKRELRAELKKARR